MTAAEHDRIVELVGAELDQALEHLTSEVGWERLAAYFREKLVRGSALWIAQIIEWADAGHPAADRALRLYAADMKDHDRWNELPVQVRAYDIKVGLRPFLPFPRGRHVVQHLMRDIWITTAMTHAAEATGLPATRSRATTSPSIGYFLACACRKRGIKLKEQEINRIFWARDKLAARLEASMPGRLIEMAPADSSTFK